MTREKETVDPAGSTGTTTTPDGPPSGTTPGGGGSTPPHVDPMSLDCNELGELISACQEQIGRLQSKLEDTPKWRFRVRLKLEGAIGAWQDLQSRSQAAYAQKGCG